MLVFFLKNALSYGKLYVDVTWSPNQSALICMCESLIAM